MKMATSVVPGHCAGINSASHVWMLKLGAVTLTLMIFLVDWLSSLDVAIAVLYVAVILISSDLFSYRGMQAVSGLCGLLILGAYLLSHEDTWLAPPFARCLVSLAAITITAILALKCKAARDALVEQVQLLRRSEALLAGAQRLSSTGSLGLKMPDGQVDLSEEARRIFEFEGRLQPTVQQLIARAHPDDTDDLKKLIQQVHAQHDCPQTEFRLLMPDGRCKNVRMLAQRMTDSSGGCEYLGALMDVTAAKNAEEALHQSQSQLAHITRVTVLGEMAASIAHEVNQPLAAVTTNAEAGLRWLDREEPNVAEVHGAVQRIMSEAHRASEVIRRIRALSCKTEPHYSPIDLQDVLQEALLLTRRETRRHKANIELKSQADGLWVQGDRIQLQQVIINLLLNALQALSSIHAKGRRLVIVLDTAPNNQVTLRVQDNGPGIPAEILPRLFEAFFTTKAEGMGMGLSICRSIIEAHGGRIWAESEPGRGASVCFSLAGGTPGSS
ncbi:PAS domain-containing sensor histidine kinase [Pseudomonas sp. REP124]|uniref:sensor histidine kinase n=1 Tax=Pseudomonas sp. REP124 TaxID=2875731 RepID=UPI001CC901A9|nr:ATP-binding protein [Pseudomonas sp. REP124]MBZ9780015.1 PAS domain-containing sensor histidine kinase [Pseudomonas sp. REP124]